MVRPVHPLALRDEGKGWRRLPDPEQAFDHRGKPEDGPTRYLYVFCHPLIVSREMRAWIARRKAEVVSLDPGVPTCPTGLKTGKPGGKTPAADVR